MQGRCNSGGHVYQPLNRAVGGTRPGGTPEASFSTAWGSATEEGFGGVVGGVACVTR
jgi:hypothetical protein